MGALSTMLREVARRLECEASHTLPEAWATRNELLGRRVCITAEDRGTAVSVMEAAANAIDSAEADRDALAAALRKIVEVFSQWQLSQAVYHPTGNAPPDDREFLAHSARWGEWRVTVGDMRSFRALLERIEKGGE